ncbi:methyltransferase [Lentilitoribacter sp. Alg239-R112]|uniref:methyltransferase n=1 Tax=Lentilitoribacter sp. Alg239-R112 TaxID=2305987 RepID=UPI0013A6D9FD|nr:methyltransferase [Lentilitoribacter sp. Alg239-R112]
MLIERAALIELSTFGQNLGLLVPEKKARQDRTAKMQQVLAYLEAIHVRTKKYSTKRELIFVEAGAGNCYLSFLVYKFYHQILNRPVRIHCIDTNADLMKKNERIARSLGFDEMYFHAEDIADFQLGERPDAVYALHACDMATDKALFLGLQNDARNVLSVSCCQHSFRKSMKPPENARSMANHTIIREKLVHMLADSMRALLLEMAGYNTSIIELVSSRATEKNLLLRGEQRRITLQDKTIEVYLAMRREWQCSPRLEQYMLDAELLPVNIVHAINS